jgi:hypothetical protein
MKVWEKLELRFRAERTFGNPYADVLVWVDLAGPGFNKRCYGFWDGGAEFAVRITAIAPGCWTWKSGSLPYDPGLSGREGSFEAGAWTEEEKAQNVCRRGFLRASSDGHSFEHADGTPCFLLGDTWWAAGTFRFPWREGDTEDTPRSFLSYAALRKAQGFNSVAVIAALPNWVDDGKGAYLEDGAGLVLRAAWSQGGRNRAKPMHDEEGNTPFFFPGKVPGFEDSVPDLDRINPEFFRGLDRKVERLNELGIMPFIEPARRDIGQVWKRYHGWPDSYARFVAYVWTRYQACNCLLSPIHYDIGEASVPAPDWNRAANRVVELYGPPPFGNPVGCNPHWSSLLDFGHVDEARWLSFHQVGNGQRGHYSYAQLTNAFDSNPPVPVLNGEPQYEGMETLTHPSDASWCFGESRVPPSPCAEGARVVRSAAYGSVLSGGLAGHIYGAGGWDGGLWRADVEDKSPVKIWEALKWPGADQMRHLKAFLLSEGARYRELRPSAGTVSPNRSGPVAGYAGWVYCSATKDKSFILAYLEEKTPDISLLELPPRSSYAFRWFDPRTGAWGPEIDVPADGAGELRLPKKPTEDDWAVKLVAAAK